VAAALSSARDILLRKGHDTNLELFACFKEGCNKKFPKGFCLS
jgi:hypothetical protein